MLEWALRRILRLDSEFFGSEVVLAAQKWFWRLKSGFECLKWVFRDFEVIFRGYLGVK